MKVIPVLLWSVAVFAQYQPPLGNSAGGSITINGTPCTVGSSCTIAAGAPTTATYITQTADAGLSAEQAMGALATGLVKNTTTTGVQSIAVPGTDFVGGQAALTTVGAVPFMSASGILGQGAGVLIVSGSGASELWTFKNPTVTTGATRFVITKGAGDTAASFTLSTDASASFGGSVNALTTLNAGPTSAINWTSRVGMASPTVSELQIFGNGFAAMTQVSLGPSTSSNPAFRISGIAVGLKRGDNTIGAFTNLPACAAGTETFEASITDSSTAVWGATVAGSGANRVLVRCNGTNWTVAAI